MHVCGLNSSGGEVTWDRGGEVTDVMPFLSGCSTTWDLRIRIASIIQAAFWRHVFN